MTKNIFVGVFTILYLFLGFISVCHAITFCQMSNVYWQAVMLGVAFELTQAAILFYMLVDVKLYPDAEKTNWEKYFPYAMMVACTIIQVVGNVFAAYKFEMLNSQADMKYFADSVLFFIADPNPQVNNVLISYFTGGILPIFALGLTAMIVRVANAPVARVDKRKKNQPTIVL